MREPSARWTSMIAFWQSLFKGLESTLNKSGKRSENQVEIPFVVIAREREREKEREKERSDGEK